MKPFMILKKLRLAWRWIKIAFPTKDQFGACGKNTILLYPLRIYSPKSVYIGDNVKLSSGLHILNAPNEKVTIKKYSVFAANCVIAPNSHRSTVSVPQFLLGASHVNDFSSDIVIEEDVWLGTGVTILSGVTIGRGCVVGAGSLVTKSLPPYAVAVGSPARIVRKNFSIDHILRHEQSLYPEEERLTREQLEENERRFFADMKEYGTDEGLDADALARIEHMKHIFHYVEPDLGKDE